MNRQLKEWEKIFANDMSNKELMSKLYKWTVCCVLRSVALSCLTLCDPMDCSPPGSSVHGNSLGKNIDSGLPLPGIFLNQGGVQVSRIAGGFSTSGATREALTTQYVKIFWLKNGQRHLNRHFSKEDHTDSQHIYERCSVSLITREMKIKTTMRYHLLKWLL